ncbi:MAG TPA: DUF2071 domain-containing protein [Chroococcales cyanobacterium]
MMHATMSASDLLASVDHRPFPPPNGPIAIKQDWHDLLFAHWPVSYETIRDKIPTMLDVDLYDGTAWIGIVPFRMVDVQPVWAPFPSNFLELNVRTYVRHKGEGGVYFFSLDASDLAAVLGARLWYGLPYYWAQMRFALRQAHPREPADAYSFSSRRLAARQPTELDVDYQAIAPVQPATRGSVEEFLTERYCLYNFWKGALYRADIHHLPWPLQIAEAEFRKNTMAGPTGIKLASERPALLHFSYKISTVAWAISRLNS